MTAIACTHALKLTTHRLQGQCGNICKRPNTLRYFAVNSLRRAQRMFHPQQAGSKGRAHGAPCSSSRTTDCVWRGPMSGRLATSRHPRSGAPNSCAQCRGSTSRPRSCCTAVALSENSPARSCCTRDARNSLQFSGPCCQGRLSGQAVPAFLSHQPQIPSFTEDWKV